MDCLESDTACDYAPEAAAAAYVVRNSKARQPDVCYVGEAELLTLVRHDELGGESDIAAGLIDARSAVERVRILDSALRVVGFSGLGYAALTLDARGRPQRAYLLRDYLPETLPRLLHACYLRHDERLVNACRSCQPLVWDVRSLVDAWRRDGADPAARRDFDEMRECGVGSGLTFGLPVSHTAFRCVVTFVAASENRDWITASVVAQALSLGLSLHQRCAAYVRAIQRREATPELSPRHRNILRLVVEGLSDKEIALRLNTTVHNVDYHLRQLREKCGALNRNQLAFIAGRTGAV